MSSEPKTRGTRYKPRHRVRPGRPQSRPFNKTSIGHWLHVPAASVGVCPIDLASATSPYLLQHADNPVDWWEWSAGRVRRGAGARTCRFSCRVGYAACHWCHVMAHESFEDDATAAYMNEHYVNIKVDREERPDVDAVYMQATTAMTGHGGWPMTVVLDHDGRAVLRRHLLPGPAAARACRPSGRCSTALAEAWSDRGDEVRQVAGKLREHLAMTGDLPSGAVGRELLDGGCRQARRGVRPDGGRVRQRAQVPADDGAGVPAAARSGDSGAATCWHRTTAAMAGGGMYDQLGGGFARYAVDRGWVVPHFEKMLYDNAQLVGLYARLGTEAGDRIARETADFMIRELRTPEGGFASALDADSPDPATGKSVEGAFYAWTPAQLVEVLGEEHGAWAADLFSVTEAGTFEHGMSTLQLRHYPATDLERTRLAHVRARLCSRPATSGRGRASTTRWSRRGTGWPSAASATPACSSASRSTSTPPSPRASSWRASHVESDMARRGGTAIAAASPGTAGRGSARGGARGLRLRGVRVPVARPGHRRRAVAHARDRPARPRARRLPRPGRRVLRHPCRRRGPGRPPAGPR